MCHATHFSIDLRSGVLHNTFMDTRIILSLLKADGWFEVAQKGSHIQLKHPTKPGRVTLPHPKRDLPLGTLKSIEQQSGLKLRR